LADEKRAIPQLKINNKFLVELQEHGDCLSENLSQNRG
jgi:hypothetical protein